MKKATGADGITAKITKATAPNIVNSLTKLFNLSLIPGRFPSDWEFAGVVPIPKVGNPESPSIYKPISVLPITTGKTCAQPPLYINILVTTVPYLSTNADLPREINHYCSS